jgi:Rieske Fe-S protein
MFISADSPTRSIRGVPVAGEELLLVGGEGHRTGTGGDTEERYRRLEAFAREHWDVRSVDYRWSAQDNTTLDGVPYIGALTPFEGRIHMATGFAKWGMTGGTAAALLLADLLQGRENAWAALFNPNRLNLRASVGRLVHENAVAAARFFGDRITQRGRRPIEDLHPGEGDIVSLAGETVAGFRDDDGVLHAVSPTCTHLACRVNWNTAERSWDCPCHGSRFSPAGDVLQGPAVHRLEHKPIE